jgi:hypothetical protein
MDQGRFTEALLRLEHRHSDGSWSRLEARPQHHDATDHDPERTWLEGAQLYVCSTCDEQVVVRNPVDDDHH